MKHDRDEQYLKEIDHVSILESIEEVFDHATSLMTPAAVMYGSTITAMIAGLPIVGDLDIAVSNQEYMGLCQNFSSSVKWVQINGKSIPERRLPSFDSHKFAMPSSSMSSSYGSSKSKASTSNPYKDAEHMPINRTVSFQTVNDARVQIMESKSRTGDHLEDALEIVRKVDFTFCGMALDMYGRMLETIPHAYDDCLQRVIRIQDYQHRTDPAALVMRIQKYLKRGWHLTMSIDQALLNLDKAKREYLKNKPKKTAKKKKQSNSGFFLTTKNKSIHICAKKTLVDMIGMSKVADVVGNIARMEYDIRFHIAEGKFGCLEFSVSRPAVINSLTATAIIRSADSQLKKQYDYGGMFSTTKPKELYKSGGYRGGGMTTTSTGYVTTSASSFSDWK